MVQRALFMSHMIVDEAKVRSIDSVGGLMQIHFVEKDGTRAIPYERWVDVDGTYGTYVKMDIDADGAWVQIHEPSHLEVPLRFPDEQDFGAAFVNFELQDRLTKDSPGVYHTPNPVKVYRPIRTIEGEWVVRTP